MTTTHPARTHRHRTPHGHAPATAAVLAVDSRDRTAGA